MQKVLQYLPARQGILSDVGSQPGGRDPISGLQDYILEENRWVFDLAKENVIIDAQIKVCDSVFFGHNGMGL